MASEKETQSAASEAAERAPLWANGLKKLYDEVVEEPLPDAFMDLLAQLDSSDDDDKCAAKAPDKNGGLL